MEILQHFVEFILANDHQQQHLAKFILANWSRYQKVKFSKTLLTQKLIPTKINYIKLTAVTHSSILEVAGSLKC